MYNEGEYIAPYRGKIRLSTQKVMNEEEEKEEKEKAKERRLV